MTGNRTIGLIRAAAAASVAALLAISCPVAHAGKYKVLYRFTGGDDGSGPVAAPVSDADGNLYGTTATGGAGGAGTVWKLAPDGTHSVLHAFTFDGDDGYHPVSGITLDKKGNVYGATNEGGNNSAGTVYRIKGNGSYDLLHIFNGSDGIGPQSRLILDKEGYLYGTATFGGANGRGVVFRLARDGIVVLLHSFEGDVDGQYPDSDLTRDSDGNLYGTASDGGNFGCGTLFKLAANNAFSVLHHFHCSKDGDHPRGASLNDAGDLFGVLQEGGPKGSGSVYRLSANGVYHTLHAFDDCCGDGTRPYGRLSMDNKYLYGTTIRGSSYDQGTVFRLALSDESESLLHSFAAGDDGSGPECGVTVSGKYLYGATMSGGGDSNAGTIFRIKK